MATAKNQDKPTPTRRPRPASAPSAAPEVTSASAWRGKTSAGSPLVVPSGNTCLVRVGGGLEAFITQGLVPNSLMPIIQEAMSKGKPPTQEEVSGLATEEGLTDVIEMLDRVALRCVVEPKLAPIPRDEDGVPLAWEDREELEEMLWVDEIVFEDKMFIFNYVVGGTADLERFRQELTGAVEAL